MKIAFLFYNAVVIPALYLGFRSLGFFNAKIRDGISGRRNLFTRLQRPPRETPAKRTTLLVHAASMGEYEQARPVLRRLRQELPQARIVLSVFSPSAYENIRDRHDADLLTYLPFDSRRNVRRFLDLLQPAAVLITRHDIWPNLLWQAQQRGIRTILFDASVHEGSLRHKPVIRQFNRSIFAAFDAICAISNPALAAMQKFLHPGTRVEITGDTRFDQVVFRARERSLAEILAPAILQWPRGVVAGSTWPEDDAVLLPAFAALQRQHAEARLILVAHEPSEAHLQHSESLCRKHHLPVQRLSQFDAGRDAVVLLVDRIGVLANLYGAGQIAFVGGAFGPGVHSVIEAAAHGLPVLFGPKMRNSAEAIDMVRAGCGFVVQDAAECEALLKRWYGDAAALAEGSRRASDFVSQRTGASERVAALVQELLAEK